MLSVVPLLLASCSVTPPDAVRTPASASTSPSPPGPSPSASGEVVHGWPDTSANAAGLYSWKGSSCGSQCNSGFMHNCYGPCNVEIHVELATGDVIRNQDGGSAATVAGHEAEYRRIDDHREEWLVDINGKTVAIRVVQRGESEAGLSEAHAIIHSMYTEPADNALGFHLVFRLTTNDWDSG